MSGGKLKAKRRPSPLAARAEAAWAAADWPALADLAAEKLKPEPGRARLALLAAAGLAQTGKTGAARKLAAKARRWGAPPAEIAEVLLAGTLTTLGRAALLLGDEARADALFDRAAAPRPGRDRAIAEATEMELLPEAAARMTRSLEELREGTLPASAAAVLQSQIELLNHTLALAQQRGQLRPGGAQPGAGPSLAARATSQLGQELWVLEQTGHKRGGFFVEFGATDGVILSNSLLLETEFGWQGICAEPNPAFFAKLKRNRSCIVAPDCIMGQSGEVVEFILADEYGGVADFAEADAHVARRAAFRDEGAVLRLTTISLDDFLKKYDAPRHIDYMSIDTEGSEYEILRTFPFQDWDIRLLTIEHNFTPLRGQIRELLEGHGYACTEREWDDWYVKTG
ncbi:FkbM family methyltransferase [Seohaeicola nanhaiensis]|uniref:FkbM family methyltransferase n=1 Tax=Seohaeicola nanhaiensis TaxID=1387282 RepID=A0ABV9KM91_9RHOB